MLGFGCIKRPENILFALDRSAVMYSNSANTTCDTKNLRDKTHLGVKGDGVTGPSLQIARFHGGVDPDVILRVRAQVHQVAVLARPAEDGPVLALLALVAHQHLVLQIRLLDRFQALEFGVARLRDGRRPDEQRHPVPDLGDAGRADVGEDLQVETVLLLVLLMLYTLWKHQLQVTDMSTQ